MKPILTLAKGKIATAAVAVCGIGNRAHRLATVEAGLVNATPAAAAFAKATEAAAAVIKPQGDMNADPAYRRDLVQTLDARALAEAAGRAALAASLSQS